MNMSCCSCRENCNCTIAALVVSAILGIVAAFLQISGTITVTAAFLWVTLGIAVTYLAVTLLTAALARKSDGSRCKCAAITTQLAGALVTAVVSLVLLGVGIVATSVVSALLVGPLVFGLVLTLTATACLARTLANCSSND